MDFAKTEIHSSIEELAQKIFCDIVDDEYHRSSHEGERGFDSDLWATLAEAGLLGASISEKWGGSAMGFLEVTALFEAQGVVLSQLPLWQSIVAAAAIEKFATSDQCEVLLPALIAGETHFSLAFADVAREGLGTSLVVDDDTISGVIGDVPFAAGAAVILLPFIDRGGWSIYMLDVNKDPVLLDLQRASNGEPHYRLSFDSMDLDASRFLGERGLSDSIANNSMIEWMLQRCYTALSALQLGVVQEILTRTAAYVSERHQFNKPLAAFQAVTHRAANGYMDCAALRACIWQAAWRLSEGLDATAESRTAKWWACEAGHRLGHTGQHLHGGLGSDVDYPIHRFFLWAKQLEFTLGGGQEQLAQLGSQLAHNPELEIVV